MTEEPRLLRDERGCYTHPEDPGELTYPGAPRRVSVSEREAALLAALAARKSVLEIGTGLGVSTRALALAAQAVHTVDPDPWVQSTIAPALAKDERIHCHTAWPLLAFDLVFIDGDHHAESVERDVREALTRLWPRGLVVLHDVHAEHVRRAAESVGQLNVLDTEHGLGLMLRA